MWFWKRRKWDRLIHLTEKEIESIETRFGVGALASADLRINYEFILEQYRGHLVKELGIGGMPFSQSSS